jgi:beta-fructofuranosidase
VAPRVQHTGYHLRPARGWLNDPNGLVHHDGRWHVFFQHNPEGPVHDRIHWGHTSSADLMTWTEHPVAFGPTPGGPDAFGCWSGVYVHGLERPAVAYTGVVDATAVSTVCLRWGSPDLMSWSQPLVVAEQPRGAGIAVMRDPYLFERGGHRWALVGAGLEEGSPAVLLYRCDDIRRWDFVQAWLTAQDSVLRAALPADVWECPQLVEVEGAPVLVLSLHDRGRLADVVTVSARWVEGAPSPQLTPLSVGLLDRGSAYYAPQAVADPAGGAPLVLGWVREDDQDPAERDGAGCMSLPRRLVRVAGGVSAALHERVREALSERDAQVWGAGSHLLVGAVRVRLSGPAVLDHAELGELTVTTGDELWVDGPVLEVYPADGSAPTTHRAGTAWRLRVPVGSGAEALPVAL